MAAVDLGARTANGSGPTATRWMHRVGGLTTGLLLFQGIIDIAKARAGLPLATANNAAAALFLVAVAAIKNRLAHATGAPLSGDRP